MFCTTVWRVRLFIWGFWKLSPSHLHPHSPTFLHSDRVSLWLTTAEFPQPIRIQLSLLLPSLLSPQCKVRKITVQCDALFSSRLSWLHWECVCVCMCARARVCVCVCVCVWVRVCVLSEQYCCDCNYLVTAFFPYLALLSCLCTELPSLSQASVCKNVHKNEHIFMFLVLDLVFWIMASRQYWHKWF